MLSVVIPAYNEEDTILEVIERVLRQGCVREIIVVDDGSTDNTAVMLSSINSPDVPVQIIKHSSNQGKGMAIQTALRHVTGDFVLIQDGDLEYDPNDYSMLLGPVVSGRAEAVYGSRFITTANCRTNRWHIFGNKMLTSVCNMITGLRLSDSATCYKLISTRLLRRLALQERGFGFCPEVNVKLARLNVRPIEVPITYKSRTWREGKKIKFQDLVHAIVCYLKYRWK
jgi:glycosyltransferase involved in cell wall biosynthesis